MVTTYALTTETRAPIEASEGVIPLQAAATPSPQRPAVTTSSNITTSPYTSVGQGALSAEHLILIEPSAGTAQEPKTRRSTEIPPSLMVTQGAKPYVTGKIHLIQGLEGIILQCINQSQVRVDGIKIEIKNSFRGKKRKPLLWVTAKAGPQVHPNQALALWDAIGTGIDEWQRRLSALDRRLLQEEISVSVDWVEPNASPAQ